MAIRHSITLSTSEPNNEVGNLKIRQGDEQTQTLVANITENGVPKPFTGLQPFFCAKLGQTAGLGIIEQKVTGPMNPANGTLEYVMQPEDWQQLGRQTAYFSFRKMVNDHEWTEQFSTRDFNYNVIKSVFSEGFREVKKDGSTYVWTIEDMLRLFKEYIATGKVEWENYKNDERTIWETYRLAEKINWDDYKLREKNEWQNYKADEKTTWEKFVEDNREFLENADPGGKIILELLGGRGGFDSLGERLDESDAQLLQNTVLRPFSMRTEYKQSKPVITFIDDDGRVEAYTILRQIALEKGFKFNSAVYGEPLKNGDSDTMTVEQLLTLQSEGHEILSHGWVRNAELAIINPNLYHRELGDSKLYLQSLGFDINSFVYQGGSYNDTVLNTIPHYYDSAFTVEPGINNQNNRPLDGYKIKRPSLDTSTLAQAKAFVDNLVENGGWLVFTSHAFYPQWATPEKQQDLRDLIDYIKSKSIDIVTVKEGLEIHGNIIDYGKLNNNYFKVDKQGKIVNPHNRFFSQIENTVFPDTPPSHFLENSMNITMHNGLTTATGFPESNMGTLITIKGLANIVEQKWYPYNMNNRKDYLYKRTNKYPNHTAEWNEWQFTKTIVPTLESEINGANPNLSTFPQSKPGKLLKSELMGNGYYTEDYDLHNSPKKYKRYKRSDGSMSEWREYCFKKDKAFSQLIPSIAQGAFLDVKFDISDLSLNVSDTITLNFNGIPPDGVMWSYYHDGTNITLRLYNFGTGATMSQTIYTRVTALVNG